MAKWLSVGPKLLILHEPTQAVDVGARQDILRQIHSVADTGVSILLVSVETMDLAEACDRVLVYSARGRWTRSRRTTPTRSSISSIHAQLHREGAMTIHDHNTQFEDVTVQPGAVDAVSDGLPEVASTTVPPTLRRRLSAGTATGARSIASKYALLVVWAAMALFFYIALPSTFGRVATLQSIFGSQEVLVFLGIAALTPSRSASSTCRSPRSWVLPPPPCRCWSPSTTGTWLWPVSLPSSPAWPVAPSTRSSWSKSGSPRSWSPSGPERCLSEWPSSSPPRARSRFRMRPSPNSRSSRSLACRSPFITAWCWSPPSPT